MEQLKEAIITPDKKIKCPYGMITGNETVRNFKIRCKGSKRGREHYFVLNTEADAESEEK